MCNRTLSPQGETEAREPFLVSPWGRGGGGGTAARRLGSHTPKATPRLNFVSVAASLQSDWVMEETLSHNNN